MIFKGENKCVLQGLTAPQKAYATYQQNANMDETPHMIPEKRWAEKAKNPSQFEQQSLKSNM